MNEQEQKAINDIEQYGCHLLHVTGDDDYPRFTYSIGIEKKTNQPDLIIIGLKPELAQWMINEYNRRSERRRDF